ncbi:agmatinase family protein [Flavicella sediminum]|uniref:agmatinase family protein n=1 Tax=Flavicella sediminum TaxID=2585141 RepID=UPI00111D4E88|nr:agmatinase family protein [Flavicella sediminum]
MYKDFDPNGIGKDNGHFIGLPFEEKEAKIVLLSAPWDVTVSYGAGTSKAPQNILNCSSQLDLYDVDYPNSWKKGIYMRPSSKEWISINNKLRTKAEQHIYTLENELPTNAKLLEEINSGCTEFHAYIYNESKLLFSQNKLVGLIGGDHSTPFGYIKALGEIHQNFGILQIDAHLDLRQAYEGFSYSHASIFYNVTKQIAAVSKLVQIGIRDYCEAEINYAKENNITVLTDNSIKNQLFNGISWNAICENILSKLPEKVYFSLDIDGLNPDLCPTTGTPVPGGLTYEQLIYLLEKIINSGKILIGFDLCEVGTKEWDGNVGARIVYKLCSMWLGK